MAPANNLFECYNYWQKTPKSAISSHAITTPFDDDPVFNSLLQAISPSSDLSKKYLHITLGK